MINAELPPSAERIRKIAADMAECVLHPMSQATSIKLASVIIEFGEVYAECSDALTVMMKACKASQDIADRLLDDE